MLDPFNFALLKRVQPFFHHLPLVMACRRLALVLSQLIEDGNPGVDVGFLRARGKQQALLLIKLGHHQFQGVQSGSRCKKSVT